MMCSRQVFSFFIAVALMSAPGCSAGTDTLADAGGDADADGNAGDAKDEARAVHLARLQAFADADAALYVSFFAADVVDLGGGATGTGELPPELLTAAHWQAYFMTQEYRDVFEGKSLDQVFDLDATEVYTFVEVEAMDPDYFGKDTQYMPQDDDMWIITPARPDSGLGDGFFAVYRNIDGDWRVVGLD